MSSRTTAFLAEIGNDVSNVAVANAWEQYDLDLATAWSDAVNGKQTAWDTCAHMMNASA